MLSVRGGLWRKACNGEHRVRAQLSPRAGEKTRPGAAVSHYIIVANVRRSELGQLNISVNMQMGRKTCR